MQTCPYCHHVFSYPSVAAQCCHGQSIDQQVLRDFSPRCNIADCLSTNCKNPFHFPSPPPDASAVAPNSNPFFNACSPFSGTTATAADHHFCSTSNGHVAVDSSLSTPHVSGHMFHFPVVLPAPTVQVHTGARCHSCQLCCRLNCLTHGGQLFCQPAPHSFPFPTTFPALVAPSQLHQLVETKLTLCVPNVEAEHRMQICCRRLEESGWYWKKLSWQQAMALLDSSDVGTFIIRDSSDPKHKFSLSVQTDRGPTSVRVHYKDGKFRLDCETAVKSSLPEFLCVIKMVQYYVHINEQIGGHVWVDVKGQVYSPIAIKKPLRTQTQTLKHLCRLAVNQNCEKKLVRLKLPVSLLKYLEEYPYWC